MLPADGSIVSGLLVPFVARTFLVLGVLAIAVGLGLVVNAAAMQRMFSRLNRWVSTQDFFNRGDAPHDADVTLTRSRYGFSVLVICGAAYSLFGLVVVFDLHAFTAFAAGRLHQGLLAWSVEAAWWGLVLGNVLALLVGIMEAGWPAALGRLNRAANRWISPQGIGVSANDMNFAVDHWVARFPRLTGLVITTGALVVVIAFSMLLAGRD